MLSEMYKMTSILKVPILKLYINKYIKSYFKQKQIFIKVVIYEKKTSKN